jgi:myo-inositol-1(or 4)-monophosphatase
MIDNNDELKLAIKAAQKAGHILKQNYNKNYWIDRKSPNELVSEIDLGAQDSILETLEEFDSSYHFVTEEGVASDIESGRNWVIDPLDGTHNYVAGLPFSGISIGLVEDNDFLLGVIYCPMEDQLYYAVKGKGAYQNGKSITVSRKTISNAIVNFDNQFHLSENSFEWFKALAQRAFTTRIFGTATMDLCLVASGKIGGRIWLNAKIHDIAAGVVIVTEAGGKITDYRGEPCSFDSRQIVASNGMMHEELLEIVNGGAQ